MTDAQLHAFFTDYGASFLRSEVEIASFYNVPCMTARQGTVHLSKTRQEVQAFFADVLRLYRSRGSTHGEMRRFEAKSLGAHSIAATVTWAYQGSTGQTLWESTFTYNLYQGTEGWKILLQTLHDAAQT